MTGTPSEHPEVSVTDAEKQVFFAESHDKVEQSAIYSDIHFHCINEKSPGIVLTSQCDIQRSEPNNYVLLARLVPVAEVFTYWLVTKHGYSEEVVFGEEPIPPGKSQRKSIIKEFTDIYLKNKTVAYYYLPAFRTSLSDSFVCCEITVCVAIKELDTKQKLCVLRSPFREAVPSFYSAYIGRIGTAQHKVEALYGILDKACKLRDP